MPEGGDPAFLPAGTWSDIGADMAFVETAVLDECREVWTGGCLSHALSLIARLGRDVFGESARDG